MGHLAIDLDVQTDPVVANLDLGEVSLLGNVTLNGDNRADVLDDCVSQRLMTAFRGLTGQLCPAQIFNGFYTSLFFQMILIRKAQGPPSGATMGAKVATGLRLRTEFSVTTIRFTKPTTARRASIWSSGLNAFSCFF
jgi:hypothetical protein